MLRGRWACNKSARRYIQAGPSLLLQQRVPPAAASLASDIAPHIHQLLSLLLAQSQ